MKMTRTETASEMETKVLAELNQKKTDWVIMTAAVADYRPKEMATQKIKKKENEMTLVLERTPDILGGLRKRCPNAFLIGFAAETETLEAYARKKLVDKELDMIVANDVSVPGIGFHSDINKVMVLGRMGELFEFGPDSKMTIANQLLSTFLDCSRARA
jgi:phosphopantothenoylcysteine decarboxylase/phosphopantothenate--cysteine ligase